MGFGSGVLTTFSEIYRRQSAVRSVVDFLAGHLARMPWKVMQQESPVLDTHLADHPGQLLLSDPSRWRGTQNFWRDFWLDWLIYDRCAAVKIDDPVDDGGTFQLVRIPPVWYTPIGRSYFHPEKIRVIGNRGFGDFDVDQCIYMHGYDPIDPRIGISPMETMRTTLEEEAQSQTWRRRFWEGNAQPSMVITRPLDAPDWDGGAKERFIEDMRKASNHGKPILLEEGMTTNPNDSQFNPQTAQYMEGRQFTREEVARFYGLPAGIFDSQSFSNVLQYRQFLYSEILVSPLGRCADELTSQLLPEWWTQPRKQGVRVVPGIEEAIRGSLSEQVAVLKDAVGIPFMGREEARKFVNLPTDETDMNKLAVPVNYVVDGVGGTGTADGTPIPTGSHGGPGGAPDSPATAANGHNAGDNGKPEAGPVVPKTITAAEHAKKLTAAEITQIRVDRAELVEEHESTLVKFFTRQSSAVKSRHGAGNKAFDKDRWNSELTKVLYPLASKTAERFGSETADKISGSYDPSKTVNYLTRNSEIAADGINQATADQLKDADDPGTVFDGLSKGSGRVHQIAQTRVTYAMNWGITEAARQSGHS